MFSYINFQNLIYRLEAFHVIKKADVGGESVFMDGFHCANLLKEQNPRAFEILTKTDVQAEFFKKGEWDLRFSDPLIKLNPLDGHLMQIRLVLQNSECFL